MRIALQPFEACPGPLADEGPTDGSEFGMQVGR